MEADTNILDDSHFDWNESYSGSATDYSERDSLMLDIISNLAPGRALDLACGAGESSLRSLEGTGE